jgi:hypothetical protein
MVMQIFPLLSVPEHQLYKNKNKKRDIAQSSEILMKDELHYCIAHPKKKL